MTCSLTKDALIAMKPCDLSDRIALFGKRQELTARQAFKAGASIRDLLWVAGKLGRKEECARFALACAQRVAKYDKSGTAQPCIDAANAYVADPSEVNLQLSWKARCAAAATYADAAATAYAAADAAADAATYAAADAADAAAYAADADATAAAAAYAADAAAAYAAADAAADAAAAAYAADAAADADAAAATYAAVRAKEIKAQQALFVKIFC